MYGIYLAGISNSTISFNEIHRPTRSTVTTFYGIFHTGGGENNIYDSNKIFNAYEGVTGTNTSASYPIYHSSVTATVGNDNKVINNLVYNINNNGNDKNSTHSHEESHVELRALGSELPSNTFLSDQTRMEMISAIPCYCDIQFKRKEFLTVLQYPDHPFAKQMENLSMIGQIKV
jgi:hypothetical protein